MLKSITVASMMQSLPFVRHFSVAENSKVNDSLVGNLLQVVGPGASYSELIDLENSGHVYLERILYMVKGIALEAVEFGASELFIGHPEELRYEFFVDDIGYQGSIEATDYNCLLRLFGRDSEIEVQVDHFEIESLTLSLTSNNSNPVVHVAWHKRWTEDYDSISSLAQ